MKHYNTDNIQLKVFCFPVTLRCNLKCKLCGAHSPYYEHPYHPDVENLFKQLDVLFQFISYIEKFDIGGGEPLLRDDIASIAAYLRLRYRKQIGILRMITNGTVFPQDDKKRNTNFIEEVQKWGKDFYLIVDKYAVKQDKSEEISSYLKQVGIPHEVRDYTNDLHCGGWVDFGDLMNPSDDIYAHRLFERCSVPRQGFFTSVVDGKLFPCGRARILFEKGIGKDYIDLLDVGVSKETKQKQIVEMLETDYLDTCRYCKGMCDDSERFLPAEQLSL